MERVTHQPMSQAGVDRQNGKFWNELCGTSLARNIGVANFSAASLQKFDDYFLATTVSRVFWSSSGSRSFSRMSSSEQTATIIVRDSTTVI